MVAAQASRGVCVAVPLDPPRTLGRPGPEPEVLRATGGIEGPRSIDQLTKRTESDDGHLEGARYWVRRGW